MDIGIILCFRCVLLYTQTLSAMAKLDHSSAIPLNMTEANCSPDHCCLVPTGGAAVNKLV